MCHSIPTEFDQNAESRDAIRMGNTSSRSPSVRTEATMRTSSNRKRGMTLPFQPHSITFDEITYSVDMPKVTYIVNV